MDSLTAIRFALWALPGIGPKSIEKIMQLVAQKGFDAQRIYKSLASIDPAEYRALGLRKPQIQALQSTQSHQQGYKNQTQALEWSQADDQHLLFYDDFPEGLKHLDVPPTLLFVKGQKASVFAMNLAIVGTRNPSIDGQINTRAFSRYLGQAGFCLVSGGAKGVDALVHETAISIGAPTIAVLGHGIDQCYPANHKKLFQQIGESGALISEFPLQVKPRPEFFPRRNRIISGLSHGVCVVEGAIKSGSLSTANWARDQGREVFAIPGSIHNPKSKGCHWLIKNGAKLVESGEDIITELSHLQFLSPAVINRAPEIHPQDEFKLKPHSNKLAIEPKPPSPESLEGLDIEDKLLKILGYQSMSLDELSQWSDLSSSELLTHLSFLEIEQKIQTCQLTGRYALGPVF